MHIGGGLWVGVFNLLLACLKKSCLLAYLSSLYIRCGWGRADLERGLEEANLIVLCVVQVINRFISMFVVVACTASEIFTPRRDSRAPQLPADDVKVRVRRVCRASNVEPHIRFEGDFRRLINGSG